MSHYRKLFLCFLGLAALPLSGADADLILKNGRIWTGDAENPWAEALAVRGARILAVGNNQPVAETAGPHTKIIDLRGRLAIPGFNDAYTQFLRGSLELTQVDLSGACTLAELQKRIGDYAAAHPKDPWIAGFGLQYECLPDHRFPTKQDLDGMMRDRPMFLSVDDGRAACVNSKALQLAAVNAHTHYTGVGQVLTDPRTSEPTGCFRDGAQSLVAKWIPEPSREKKLAALEQGVKLAASFGITSIQNAIGDAELLSLFEELERQHKLTLRVNVALSVSPSMQAEAIDQLLELKQNYHSLRLRAGAVKFTIEAHTAAMLAPYSDASNGTGKSGWTQEAFNALVVLCDSGGLQVVTYARGDRAVRMALDGYEEARKVNGAHDARFRIERIQVVSPMDLPRFAHLGVLASMEPFPLDPAALDAWSRAIGGERLKFAFPWHSLEQAGVRLAFSSDWPALSSLDPIHGIHNVVNRQTPDGKPPGGWVASQRVTVETALRAYTVNGAYASFEEKMKGKLKEGMLADIVVLSEDLFSIAPTDIYKTRADLTIFDGQAIYTRQ